MARGGAIRLDPLRQEALDFLDSTVENRRAAMPNAHGGFQLVMYRYYRMFYGLFHGKSESQMDDDWGYPQFMETPIDGLYH